MMSNLLVLIFLFSIVATGESLRIYNRGIGVTTRGTRLMATSPVDISAQGMDLTEALKSRVTSKIGKVINKLGSDAVSTKVVLYLDAKDSQIVEATVQCKNGNTVCTSQGTDDMYASIDLISHKLAQGLKKHNQKLRTTKRKGGKDETDSTEAQALSADELAEDDFNVNELLEDLDERYMSLVVEE